MKIGLQEIDWKLAGATLAHQGDNQQADFFKSFVKECKSWGTHYQVEFQLAGVNQKLTKEEREIISMLGFEEESWRREICSGMKGLRG